ncbi:uncharacterized protein LOC110028899 [Phalaenopsis equestris]|uniref:uncharacterized protein LOC110028899 n=1 Tax=Phalaenopsis equestris TaxID=78828 RepID=UPI0009E2DD53|nr:uncharacterized protein LOC110028899 [Phalaenopsis equestris]
MALGTIDGDEAARADGFTSTFYIKAWSIAKKEVIEAVQSFFRGLNMPKYFALSTVTLIPKDEQENSWDKFRSIALTYLTSKLISKIIIYRLQSILPRIISSNQSAFVKGRQTTDKVLLTQELILDIDKPCRVGNLMFKLDLSKAYDTISWRFILTVLKAKGFNFNFCMIIQRLLQISYYTILVNGSSTGFSPTIFILARDYLSKLLDQAYLSHEHKRFANKINLILVILSMLMM